MADSSHHDGGPAGVGRRRWGLWFIALLLALLALGLGVRARARAVAALTLECAGLEEQVARLQAEQARSADLVAGLTRTLDGLPPERPGLPEVLLEITRRLGQHAWVESFRWSDGRIMLTVVTSPADDLARLVVDLESSPLLGEVLHEWKKVDQSGRVTSRYNLLARHDLPGEKAAEPLPLAQTAAAAASPPSLPPPPPPPPPAEGTVPAVPPAAPAQAAAPAASPPPPPPPPPALPAQTAAPAAPPTAPAAADKGGG